MRILIVFLGIFLFSSPVAARENWEPAEPYKTPGGVWVYETATLAQEFGLNEFSAVKKFSGKKIVVEGRVRTVQGSIFPMESGNAEEFIHVELAPDFSGGIVQTQDFDAESITPGDWIMLLCTDINRARGKVIGICAVVNNGRKELDGYHPKFANAALMKKLGLKQQGLTQQGQAGKKQGTRKQGSAQKGK
ncbi:hypothetical protein LJC46_02015 [Desulfovibrio sp. OttesenSCG-928-G15]|nr:hypothetical protein [Desulfovibrio sp. OttesenSCG-928-G15]